MEAQELAKKIVHRLVDAGYETYFAGGWVRDYLLGHPRSDIDIATAASPEEVQALFSHTFAVGAQFGVILVIEGEHQFEVSSFRKDGLYVDGRRPEGVEYATAREDVQRRDFTINGMFYDPLEKEVYDWVGGKKDLDRKIIRAIGVAEDRIAEDRLRMLRGVRMASRFQFAIDVDTEKAILRYADTLLPAVAMERIWSELQKMAESPHFADAIQTLHRLGLLVEIFPSLKGVSQAELKERLASLSRMPDETPVIARLAELFPNLTYEGCRELTMRLRTARADCSLLEKIWEGRQLVECAARGEECPLADWIRYYAREDSELCLLVIHARYGEVSGAIEEHRLRMEEYAEHIDRIREKRPVVDSRRLRQEGISPGPGMGALLREAETIAIHHGVFDPDQVVERLQMLPVWPQEKE